MKRVGVLTSHPIQYNAPLFQRLARRLDLTVLYCSSLGTAQDDGEMANFGRAVVWDLDLLEGYRSRFLRNPVNAHPQRRGSMINPEIVRETARHDVMVNFGWAYPVDWLSFISSRARGVPFLLYGDTDVRDEGHSRIRPLRRAALGWLCRAAAGALYTGTFNRDFYVRHGISPERLWFSPWAVDRHRFAAADRASSRASIGLRDDTCYFLFVGTLIERKRPQDLIEAIAALQREGHAVGVIVAGSGALDAELRNRAKRLGLNEFHMLGFVNQRELPAVYAAADVFVLPSEKDPRATVVNEAMSAGLPVVISSGTGVWGPGDLVKDGREGLVVTPRNVEELVAACRRLVDPDYRAQMATAAAERVEGWSYEVAVEGWAAAVDAVT